ncbi:hypothetical protein [Pseudomonas sp. NPDC086278]|uniref:hypothetical protein n=1 Tax=Pseudomonas sp. NPDC086278 TaxID=3390646 RepID=UPI003CFF72B4
MPTLSLIFVSVPVSAACTLVAGPGNDSFTCDGGTSGALTDLAGNNSLTFPANGTGRINGNVTFGADNDAVTWIPARWPVRWIKARARTVFARPPRRSAQGPL